MLPDVEHVVVIGGGVLGLEAAWELKKAGCRGDGSGSGLSVDGTSA